MSKIILSCSLLLLVGCGSEITEHGWTDVTHICRSDDGVKYAHLSKKYFSGTNYLSVKCNNGAYYEVTPSGWLSNKTEEVNEDE